MNNILVPFIMFGVLVGGGYAIGGLISAVLAFFGWLYITNQYMKAD